MSFHFGVNAAPSTPQVWRVVDVEVSIAAGATSPTIKYRWKRPLAIVYMKLGVLSGSPTDLRGLELAWDDGQDQLITTGRAPSTLAGGAFDQRWVPMQVEVTAGQVHSFTFSNRGTVAVTPRLLFRCVEGDV